MLYYIMLYCTVLYYIILYYSVLGGAGEGFEQACYPEGLAAAGSSPGVVMLLIQVLHGLVYKNPRSYGSILYMAAQDLHHQPTRPYLVQ